MKDIEQLIKEIDEYTKKHVKPSRYEHSVRVAQMCQYLCKKFNLDEKKGYLAGIGHDMCKDLDLEKMIDVASRDGEPIIDFEKKKPAILHGRAAAVKMKEKFGIYDAEILEAVANHTSGMYGMCDLTKILFLADKIEPGRPQSTDEYRARLFSMNLDEMTGSIIIENYEYVKSKGYEIYPGTEKMVEYYRNILNSKGL